MANATGDSFLQKWARRAVTVPGFVLTTLAFCGTLLIWLSLAAILDLSRGASRWPRVRAVLFFAVYLVCEVAGMTLATLLWLATGGGRLGGATRYRAANALLQRAWTDVLFWGAVRLFSMRVEVEPHARLGTAPLLLFVRHSSTADTVLAAALVANPEQIGLRYVLKRELLWDPCLDIVGRRLRNAFIDRKKSREQSEVEAIARLGDGLEASSAVLIYPEGTRFSAGKLLSAVAKLRAGDRPALTAIAEQFEHVLPPHPRGALALLDAAPEVDVMFVEHAGLDDATTLPSFWRGGLIGRTIRVRLRRISAAEIPHDERALWLFEQWREVDRWIGRQLHLAAP